MRLAVSVLAIAAVLGAGYYFLIYTPTMEFVLDRTDGTGAVTYVCAIEKDAATTASRAEAAHLFFQEQIAAVTAAAEKGMQEATDAAAAAGTTPDFTAIDMVRADLTAATMSVVQDMYGCAVTVPPATD